MVTTVKIEDEYDKELEMSLFTGSDNELGDSWVHLLVGAEKYSVRISELKSLLEVLNKI